MVDKIIEDLIVAYMINSMLQYLKKNTKDSISNIAINMVLKGININFVSKLTGLSVSEINKLQHTWH